MLLSPPISLWPTDADAASRGTEAASAGNWRRAALEFNIAVHQSGAPVAILQEFLLAQAAAGDRAGSGQTLGQLSRRLATEKDVRFADNLFYYARIVVWDRESANILLEYARRRVASKRDADRSRDLGIALYRSGLYAEAERALAESVKLHGKGGSVETWLFQVLLARRQGKYDEAEQTLRRVEEWYGKQKFALWQHRAYWEVLLREARKVVRRPPRMESAD